MSMTEGRIRVSARVEPKKARRGQPAELWFEFPPGSDPVGDPDPFVLALLLPAMQNRESIEIRGTLSRELLLGLQAYQEAYAAWFPDRFHVVTIQADSL